MLPETSVSSTSASRPPKRFATATAPPVEQGGQQLLYGHRILGRATKRMEQGTLTRLMARHHRPKAVSRRYS
jgi:hypothetical protein